MRKTSLLLPLALAGCASTQPVMSPLPTASVTPNMETEPVETVEDAADDPAIWRNAENPAQSLIVATDKRAGIHVYDLQGKKVGFTPSPRLNNVVTDLSKLECLGDCRVGLFIHPLWTIRASPNDQMIVLAQPLSTTKV